MVGGKKRCANKLRNACRSRWDRRGRPRALLRCGAKIVKSPFCFLVIREGDHGRGHDCDERQGIGAVRAHHGSDGQAHDAWRMSRGRVKRRCGSRSRRRPGLPPDDWRALATLGLEFPNAERWVLCREALRAVPTMACGSCRGAGEYRACLVRQSHQTHCLCYDLRAFWVGR